MRAPIERELVIDSFAGGGGASTGIEMALGRSPDVAINHDAIAMAMHAENHPETLHVPSNIWKVDPDSVIPGKPVGLLWASPDCTDHSKAKGGRPVRRHIRDLAWVVVLWAKRRQPRVIILENVEEFREWGPLIPGKDGELMRCPERRGATFKRWVRELKRLRYKVEWRELRGCDYGAPTIRKRLFVIARRDGLPIVWPRPTHSKNGEGGRKPYRTAAEIIDWSLPCPSIFMDRKEAGLYFEQTGIRVNRPLADNTMARVAKGVKRYVLDAAKPFIVSYYGKGDGGDDRTHGLDEPIRVQTTENRHAVVTPVIVRTAHGEQDKNGKKRGQGAHDVAEPLGTVTASRDFAVAGAFMVPRYGERPGQEPRTHALDVPSPTVVPTGNGHQLVAPVITKFRKGSAGAPVTDPMPTITANSFIGRPGGAPPLGVVAAFLAQHNYQEPGHDAREPVSTIVSKGCTQAVVSAGLVNMKGSDRRMSAPDAPLGTITAGGWHQAEVRAFLVKYFGTDQDPRLDEPMHTATTKDRFGVVLVEGEPYEIVDIGMRMLSPRELFRAQGFPDSYITDRAAGLPVTKTDQIRMCGNSVCPQVAEALVRANCSDLAIELEKEAA